jgi:NADPH-dependent 2,4-dienoyl-CoA reductase/sulfur reductase-like enzyme
VFVTGGGPAGLEAARVASLRGNRVILYEQEDELGGELRFAWISPFKGVLREFLKFLITQVRNSNVEIRLGKRLTYREVKALRPDIIVLAVGRVLQRLFTQKATT